MAKILGLDLGTNSAAFSLIDNQTKEILKTGVRIFPEGVNDINTSKEKSKNADKRTAKGIRRNNYRFKMRRDRLKKALKELGMSPDDKYYTFKKKDKRNNEKNYLTKELYKLRKESLERPLQLKELGRIFLHLNNHRGFKSNKKEEADKEFTNKIKDADRINTIDDKNYVLSVLNKRKEKLLKEIESLKQLQRMDAQKRIASRNNKIKSIEKKIKEVQEKPTLQEKINKAKEEEKIKHGTLGEYYYYLIEANKNTYNPNSPNITIGRLRNNDEGDGEYTTREIFEFEFDKIWERQKELNKNNKEVSAILTDKNKKKIKDECIFYQRDLRSQKHLVDKCNYEFTKYFIYKFDNDNYINQIKNLTYSDYRNKDIKLNDKQINDLSKAIEKKKEITVAEIKRIIEIKDEYYKDENGNRKTKTIINSLPDNKIIEKDYYPCCHKSSLEFQELRIWEQINNLRYVDNDDVEHSLTLEQKRILANKLNENYELIIETGNKVSQEEKEEVDDIKEELGLKKDDKFKEIQRLKGNITLTKLTDALGNDYWDKLYSSELEAEIEKADKTTGEIYNLKQAIQYSEKQKQLYNHIVFATSFIKSVDWLKGTGKANKWKETIAKFELNNEQLDAYSKVTFEPDYCEYSLKAIKELLPWMKQGYNSSQAAEKAGYESASDERKNEQFLQDNLPELKTNTLRNPIVQRGVTETVYLINEIIEKELGNQKPDKIHLEMARELKKPKKARQEAKRLNDEENNRRKEYARFLKVDENSSIIAKFKLYLELAFSKEYFEKHKNDIDIKDFKEFCKQVKADSKDLEKLKLYYECDRILPYTGKPISLERLLKEDSDIEIEHIVPFSRCLDNSFLNKTLSDREFNTKKGKKTPMEYFVDENEKKAFIKRVNKIDNEEKRKRFLIEGEDELNNFKNSQITNTAYIGTEVKKHLLKAFRRDDIVMTNGQITSLIRGLLGFNSILNPPLDAECNENGRYWAIVENGNILELIKKEKDKSEPKTKEKNQKIIEGSVYNGRFYPKKQRNDHRHHAIDAIVIALTTDKIVKIIEKNTEGYYMKEGKILNDFEDGAVWVNKFDEDGILTKEARENLITEIKNELNFGKLWVKAKEAIEYIPISYNNKHRIISTSRKKVHKKIKTKDINGNKIIKDNFYSGGDIARGALHEASLYSKTQELKENEFVKRIKVKDLTWSQILRIVDVKIKSILITDVAKYTNVIFQKDKINDTSISNFKLSFEDLVKLDIEKTSYKEEIDNMDEQNILNDEEKSLIKELKKKIKEIDQKIKPDKEKNKKGKNYKDYLVKGFKEAMKNGFYIENLGKNNNSDESNKIIRQPVPIKKVRVKYISTSMLEYKPDYYNSKAFVEPGENYGIAVYGNEFVNNNDEEKRAFKSVSFYEAVKIEKENLKKRNENIKRKEEGLKELPIIPIYPQNIENKSILTFLSKKDMVLVYKEHPDEISYLIGNNDLSVDDKELIFKRLFYVRKTDKNGLIILQRHHVSGTKDDVPVSDLDSFEGNILRRDYNTFKGRKVIVDRLGNIKEV